MRNTAIKTTVLAIALVGISTSAMAGATVVLSEPSSLGLIAAGAAVAGVLAIKNRRKK